MSDVDTQAGATTSTASSGTENADTGASQASQPVSDQAQDQSTATAQTANATDSESQIVDKSIATSQTSHQDANRDQTGKPVVPSTATASKQDTPNQPIGFVKGGKVPQTADEWKAFAEARDKSYRASQSEYGKLQNRYRQAQEQYKAFEGVDAEAVRKYKEAQEQARLKNLPKHDPSHPEHARFVENRAKLINLRDQYSKATPEEKPIIEKMLQSSFNEDEHKDLRAYQDAVNEFIKDPVSASRNIAAEAAASAIADFKHEMAMEKEIDQKLSDPSIKPLVEKYESELTDAVNHGVPFEYATVMARQREQIEQMQASLAEREKQLGTLQTRTGEVEEKERLLKGSATISRDGVSHEMSTKIISDEVKEIAVKRGIDLAHPSIMQIIREVVAKRNTA